MTVKILKSDEKIESASERPDIFGSFKWMKGVYDEKIRPSGPPVNTNKEIEDAIDVLFNDPAIPEKNASGSAVSKKVWSNSQYIEDQDKAIFAGEKGYDDSETRNAFIDYLRKTNSFGSDYLKTLIYTYFSFPAGYRSRKLVPDPFGEKHVDFAVVVDGQIKGMVEVECLNKWTTAYDMTLEELQEYQGNDVFSFLGLSDSDSVKGLCKLPDIEKIYKELGPMSVSNWPENYTKVHFLERKARYLEKPYPYLHLAFSHDHTIAIAYIREVIESVEKEFYTINCDGMSKKDQVRRIDHKNCFMIDFYAGDIYSTTYGETFVHSHDYKSIDQELARMSGF